VSSSTVGSRAGAGLLLAVNFTFRIDFSFRPINLERGNERSKTLPENHKTQLDGSKAQEEYEEQEEEEEAEGPLHDCLEDDTNEVFKEIDVSEEEEDDDEEDEDEEEAEDDGDAEGEDEEEAGKRSFSSWRISEMLS